MNFSQLQTRVLARLNMSTDDPQASLADEYVNEALHIIEASAPNGWPWMRRTITVTTTASTQSYSFSTIGALESPDVGIAKVLGVKVLNNGIYMPLRLMSPDEAAQLFPTTTTGVPEAWFAEGQTLYLYPSPNAAFTLPVRVVITETDLEGSSSPVLPVQFHTAIVEAASMLFYETLADWDKAGRAQAQVDVWIKKMQAYGREYMGAPQVRVREWL